MTVALAPWRLPSALLVVALASACARPSAPADAADPASAIRPREGRIHMGNVDLYSRDVGRGQPMIVLHGGPDFDHRYLVPDLDRWADGYRLLYYDQRGRGLSADGVSPEDVTLGSDVDDIDHVRQRFQLEKTALLGHSWGTVLALEYAVRYPERVSHLVLMNPAPASTEDFRQFREQRQERLGSDLDRLKEVAASPAYRDADPEAVVAYYRIHFKHAVRRPEDLEKVIAAFRPTFTRDGVRKARAVEDRLMKETWLSESYDVLSKVHDLKIPTLVLYGDADFIPRETSTHIAQAIPGARFVTLRDCGHFAYLECPAELRRVVDEFFDASGVARKR